MHAFTGHTFHISSYGVETGDLVGASRVAPEDVVLRINTNSEITQILLTFSFQSARGREEYVHYMYKDAWSVHVWLHVLYEL